MRKFIKICSLLVLFAVATYAQNTTVTISSVAAPSSAGASVTVPITVMNFDNVGSATFKIQYNNAVAVFDSVSRGNEFLAGASGGEITIARAEITAATPTDGTLLNLYFTYIGGTTNLTFDTAESEVTDVNGSQIAGVVFVNGGIFLNPAIVNLPDVTVPTINGAAIVPVTVTNFNNIGSATFNIAYDPAVARFDSASRSPEFLANANNGVVTIARAEITAATPTNGTLLTLYFTALGGTTALDFSGTNELTTTTGTPVNNVIFDDGMISGPTPQLVTVDLGEGSTNTINTGVTVPVTVTNFTNVGSITLNIQYNDDVARFDSVSRGGEFTANAQNGVLTIARAEITAVTPTSGTLFNIYFTSLGGTTALTFSGTNEVTDLSGNQINATFAGGSVTGPTVTVDIGDVNNAMPGQAVTIPIAVQQFMNVGSLTFNIQYNPAVARFDSASRSPEFTVNASGGVISIVRAEITAVTPTNGTLLNLYFTYNSGATALTFTGTNEVSNTSGTIISGVNFLPGSLAGAAVVVDIQEVVAGATGSTVAVPVNVTNFNNVGSATLNIQYNPAVATFDSVSRSPEFLASANGGVITVARAEITAATPTTGTLFNLYFTYNSGSTPLTFTGTNELTTTTGQLIVGVSFLNGSITSPTATVVAIDSVEAEVDSTVAVPIDVANFNNVGSLTFNIQYDQAVATFDSVSRSPEFLANANGGVITIARAEITAATPANGTLVNMYFTYHGGTTALTFTGTNEVTTTNGTQIQGVLFVNGQISLATPNNPPVFTVTLADTTVMATDTLTFQYAATDADGDQLTFALLNPPAGASITPQGLLTYIPVHADSNMNKNIIVSVSDGVATAIDTAVIHVDPLVSVIREPGVPEQYEMAQNYPNPFNPVTRIKFSIPSESYVTLKIYNLLGEEVASLVNEVMPYGNYEYSFDASSLSSGVYIYRIQAGSFISSKKMTLVK